MNRTLLITLGGVAAAVLLFVFVVSPLLFGGDDGADEGPVAVADTPENDDLAHEPAKDPEAETIADESAPQPVPETFEVFTARDPFQQLVVDDAVLAAAEPSDGSDAGGEDADADAGDADAGDGGEGDDEDLEPVEDVEVDGTTVRLEEVFEDDDGSRAQVTVNARGYDVAEGDDFASRFRLLELSDQCATLLYGDQRFTLCEGETIRK